MDNEPQYRSPDGSAVRIWNDVAKNNFLSDKHGRAIYDDVIYVEVITPGSSGACPVFEVERTFAVEMNHPEPLQGMQYERFAAMIEQFKNSEKASASMSGTPLSEWPEISRSMAASLKEARIYTVDALASLPDTKLGVVGPDGRTLRDKAQAFLRAAEDSSYATSLASELSVVRAELAERDAQMQAMAAQLDALMRQQTGVSDVLAATVDAASDAAAETAAQVAAQVAEADVKTPKVAKVAKVDPGDGLPIV